MLEQGKNKEPLTAGLRNAEDNTWNSSITVARFKMSVNKLA